MTRIEIPKSLFDDLSEHIARVFDRPSCACFLAVDAALPTSTARWLLEHLRMNAEVLGVELRSFASQNSAWLAQVLPNEQERRRIEGFGEELTIFVAPSAVPSSDELLSRIAPVVRQIALMLAIYDEVLFRHDRRLHWLFQASVAALQAGLCGDHSGRNPIGRRLLMIGAGESSTAPLSPNTVSYLRAIADAQPGFAYFDVSRTTQLRVLYHLALAVYPKPLSEFEAGSLSHAGRRTVTEHLSTVLCEGLERAPGERSSAMADVFVAGMELAPARRARPAPREDGKTALLEWLRDQHASEALLTDVIASLDLALYPDANIQQLAGRLNLEASVVERILRKRVFERGRDARASMDF